VEKVLVTGGCGFIGSNFVRYVLLNRDYQIINLDALTYAGNPENLADCQANTRYDFVRGRIEDAALVQGLCDAADAVVHFAAESHVDRSISDARPFIISNVLGTQVLLDAVRKSGRVRRFVHVSTDEVYGSLALEAPAFAEADPLRPNSPYAASKAASDLLVRAAWKTYGLPVLVTRCSNNYGPYQFPEKLIPLMIANVLADRPLPVYGDGGNIRDWIHVLDHCEGVLAVLEKGKDGEVYNLGGECELANLTVVRTILEALRKPESLIRFIKDRPGHDRRYAMDITKIKTELGWRPKTDFAAGIRDTIGWYVDHRSWCDRIISGEYRKYYELQYGSRLEVAP
jgi:dTDP-glucose 4,6-dehydratase